MPWTSRVSFPLSRTRAGRAGALVIAALAGSSGLPPHAARAQGMSVIGGPSGFSLAGAGDQPALSGADLDRYADMLGFDAAQREAAAALLQGMQAELQASNADVQRQVDAMREEFRDKQDPSIFAGKMPELMRNRAKAHAQLVKGFIADLESIATPAQQEASWAMVERAVRRDQTMGRGRLSAESVDLIRLVSDLKLPPDAKAALEPILARYEMDLDRALTDRNALIDRARAMATEGPPSAGASDPKFEALRAEAREARTRVQEVNQRYARQIVGAVPEDSARVFTSEFQRRSFPEVYAQSHAAQSLAAAVSMDDLTPEQRTALEEIRSSHDREAARLNEQWAKSVSEREKTAEGYAEAISGPMRLRMGADGAIAVGSADQSQAARSELDGRTVERLGALLSDAQRQRLPAKPRPRGVPGFVSRDGGGVPAPPLGDGSPSVVVIQGDPLALPPVDGPGGIVNVTHTFRIGPDGKPVETTDVQVHPIGAGGPDDGAVPGADGEKVETETAPAPPEAAPTKPD